MMSLLSYVTDTWGTCSGFSRRSIVWHWSYSTLYEFHQIPTPRFFIQFNSFSNICSSINDNTIWQMVTQVMVGRQQEEGRWQPSTQRRCTALCTCSYNHFSTFKNIPARNLITLQFDELNTPWSDLSLWQLGMETYLQFKNYENFLHCNSHRFERPMDNTIWLVVINTLCTQQEVEKQPQNFLHTYLRRTFIPIRIYTSWWESNFTHTNTHICMHTYAHTCTYIQGTLVLCNFILRKFTLTWLENLEEFSNSRHNFHPNTIWHRQSVVTLVEFTQ
jgi:hypothetical protein